MFVTTLAPITLPYLEKMIFRSVARVSDDNPETHKFLLAGAEFAFVLEADDKLFEAFEGVSFRVNGIIQK